MNMTLCSMTLKDMRPALRRTMLLGMRMRAVAMVRAWLGVGLGLGLGLGRCRDGVHVHVHVLHVHVHVHVCVCMRRVAMVRAIWKTSGCYYTTLRCLTIWKTSGGVKSPRGVPSTGTSALIGTW